eukprot:scaffold82885_cov30-Cyclotella_meneghiniana.AAC.1
MIWSNTKEKEYSITMRSAVLTARLSFFNLQHPKLKMADISTCSGRINKPRAPAASADQGQFN